MSSYQPLLTVIGDDTTGYKLLKQTNVLRQLIAGTNISISVGNTGNDLTINGPDLPFISPILANFVLQGGGTVSWTGSYLTWDTRVLVLPLPAKSSISLSGHYDTTVPASGTQIARYATDGTTASSVSATASGIPLGLYDALYVILPIGNNPPPASNFAIASFNNSGWTPNQNWILLAARNGDTGQLKWQPGQITLPNPSTVGQSVVSFNAATGYRSWCPDSIGSSALTQGFVLAGNVSNTNYLYYHICTLYLPQGGNQARITVNCLNDYRMNAAGTGSVPIPNQQYNVYNTTSKTITNPPQNYVIHIHIYSSN